MRTGSKELGFQYGKWCPLLQRMLQEVQRPMGIRGFLTSLMSSSSHCSPGLGISSGGMDFAQVVIRLEKNQCRALIHDCLAWEGFFMYPCLPFSVGFAGVWLLLAACPLNIFKASCFCLLWVCLGLRTHCPLVFWDFISTAASRQKPPFTLT